MRHWSNQKRWVKAVGSSSILQFGCSARTSQSIQKTTQLDPALILPLDTLPGSITNLDWLLGLIDFCKNRKLLLHIGSFLSWPFPSNSNTPLHHSFSNFASWHKPCFSGPFTHYLNSNSQTIHVWWDIHRCLFVPRTARMLSIEEIVFTVVTSLPWPIV